jgi:uncharacterized protein YgbK (DUF1537 family)
MADLGEIRANCKFDLNVNDSQLDDYISPESWNRLINQSYNKVWKELRTQVSREATVQSYDFAWTTGALTMDLPDAIKDGTLHHRLHLANQTNLPIHSIDVNHLSTEEVTTARYTEFSKQRGFILFDVLTTQHLLRIGNILEDNNISEPQLLVGSSAIEYALCYSWQKTGRIAKQPTPTFTKAADRYVIMAGSCSPATANQIQYGLSIGYKGIRIDSIKLLENPPEEIQRCVSKALDVLSADGVPMLFSAIGPDDACIEETKEKWKALKNEKSISDILANAQGEILKAILDKTSSMRVTVAGGDTSGFVSKKLGIHAFEVLVPIAPGSPLCVAHAKDKKYDGLEICLKGGQNGTDRHFEFVRKGKAN